MVLLVGSNPSIRCPDPSVPFVGTRSGSKLDQWKAELGSYRFIEINACRLVTEDNRRPKTSELDLEGLRAAIMEVRPRAVVALGKTAADALRRLGAGFFEMPHPSGRNRLLNDRSYERMMVRDCKRWLEQAEGSVGDLWATSPR